MESMFLFEVIVENVKSKLEGQEMFIRAEFADIFSLDIKEPKQLNLKIPEPPPPPPAPVGKKGKKAKPPKKAKKGKKGKAAAPPPPPAEPLIQSGQSCLFPSSVEFLIENMKSHPLVISLWNKDKMLVYIGSTRITWDPSFFDFLKKLTMCTDQIQVSNTVKGDHNIFEEETSKLMATVTLQVKLTHLRDKITTQFKVVPDFGTLEANTKKILYRGCDTASSFMCNIKTRDTGSEGVQSTFVEKLDETVTGGPIQFADYRNAPATNISFDDNLYGCHTNARCPEVSSKLPNKAADLNYMAEYVNKMIRSCNDSLKMLSPRPEIRPRFRAVDLENRCHCNDDKIKWPDSELAKRMKNFAEYKPPCPICSYKPAPDEIDLEKIKGPCGNTDCHIAKGLREYLCQMAEEDKKPNKGDNKTVSNPHEAEGGNAICKSILNSWLHDRPDDDMNESSGPCNNPSCSESGYTGQAGPSPCTSTRRPPHGNCGDSSDEEYRCSGGYCANCEDNNDQNNTIVNICMTSQCFPGGGCDTPQPACRTPEDQSTGGATPASSGGGRVGDEGVTINIDDIGGPCGTNKFCAMADKVKEYLVNQVENQPPKAGIKDPCFCDCDCKFDWKTKTTYCFVCGGYEFLGDDLKDLPPYSIPNPPCPIYHKSYEVSNLTVPNTGFPVETSSKSKPVPKYDTASQLGAKSVQKESKTNTPTNKRSTAVVEKNIQEADKDGKKNTKKGEKKKRGKFTFNYGFKGIPPQIGHDRCFIPHAQVPKHMGWLWTAEDVPGMKPRPDWKPGAALKSLVRKYRHIRGSGDIILKKKRALKSKTKKKDVKKPTITISKKDGEFNVQMEVVRKYSKDRMQYQYPYEDVPPFVYQIGRTDEQNAKRTAKRERRERREQRRKTKFVQSTFRNMCEEICLKAYQQAIGVLPTPNPNDPDCPCYPDKPDVISISLHSCSCDESSTSEDSSDGDEWLIEFTPPTDKFDVEAPRPPHVKENDCQYNYLDFRVKLVDKNGNAVPRFFIGPDGQEVCSDLGGFYGPDGKWLEIGTDGYIGPDGKWVPMGFLGPDGTWINAEDGTFVDGYGKTLTIGVDGYVDGSGKWVYYPPVPKPRRPSGGAVRSAVSDVSMWTCLPHVTPSFLATRKIVPHGRDKTKMKTRVDAAVAAGADLKMPETQRVPRFRNGNELPAAGKSTLQMKAVSGVLKKPAETRPGTRNKVVISPPPTAPGGQSTSKKPAGAKTAGKPSRGGKQAGGKDHDHAERAGRAGKGSSSGSPTRSIEEHAAHQAAMDSLKKGGDKDVCRLARMRKEGYTFSKRHKECLNDEIGDCCVEQGGFCQDVFVD